MYLLRKDQQLLWSVSPLGSKLNFLKKKVLISLRLLFQVKTLWISS